MTKHTSVIYALPTFNEVESLGLMVEKFRKHNLPFFVVDANSTDGTIELAQKLDVEIHQRKEFGKGYGSGILKAMSVAHERGYEYLGFIDCDNTYPVESFKKMVDSLSNNDMVVGARDYSQIDFIRRIGNSIHSIFGSFLFAHKITDINSGMRIIKLSTFLGKLNARNMGMVASMTCYSIKNNIPFKEIPIIYGERIGESKLKLTDGLVILYYILFERFR